MALIDNLLAYWKCDEGSGNLVDSEGSLDLVPSGSPVFGTTGIINDCVTMNSNDDNFSVASGTTFDFGTTSDFTYNIWIFRNDVGGGDDGNLFASEDYPFTTGLSITQNASKIFSAAGGTQIFDGTITNNAWSMYTVVRRGETDWEIYVNASSVGTFGTSKTVNGGNMNMADTRADRHSIWLRDEIGIWGKALSESEIDELYNSGSGLAYPFSSATIFQINIGDAWKEVPTMKINIGDAWKEVVGIQENVGDAWKEVF